MSTESQAREDDNFRKGSHTEKKGEKRHRERRINEVKSAEILEPTDNRQRRGTGMGNANSHRGARGDRGE